MAPWDGSELMDTSECRLFEARHDVTQPRDFQPQQLMTGTEKVVDKLVAEAIDSWSCETGRQRAQQLSIVRERGERTFYKRAQHVVVPWWVYDGNSECGAEVVGELPGYVVAPSRAAFDEIDSVNDMLVNIENDRIDALTQKRASDSGYTDAKNPAATGNGCRATCQMVDSVTREPPLTTKRIGGG